MSPVTYNGRRLTAYAWRQLLEIAEDQGIKHDSKTGFKIEDLAWRVSTRPAQLLELQGKQHRRYFSHEINSDRYWSNMSGLFFVHASNAHWRNAMNVLTDMESMATRYAFNPWGEIEN